MQIAILQLSDIHINNARDPVLTRAAAIAAALHDAAPHASICIVVISGDIAFSGQVAQYDAALKFLDELRTALRGYPAINVVEFVAVPGNHDCDLTHESSIREFLLRDVEALYESEVHPDGDVAKAIVRVHDNFFSFNAKLTNSKELPSEDRLTFGKLITVQNYSIKFQCYNTAWLSTKHEVQGKLFLPTQALEPIPVDASISISLFHHPYNWLDANNYRALRDIVEQTSDIVFTGHEHQLGASSVERFSGEHLRYVEGLALQGENGILDSGFNVLVLDIDAGEERLHSFRWNGEIYVSRDKKAWASLIKNPARERHLFRLNQRYAERLSDPGAAFHHKRVRHLRLSDFYVYPDFKKLSVETVVSGKKTTLLYSKDAFEYFRTTPLVVVSGFDDCGKTALLRHLYMQFSSDCVPLFLFGSDLKGKITESRLDKIIAERVEEQYDDAAITRFRQLPPERRLLLIDDFELSNQTRTNENLLIELLRDQFGRIIICISDLFRIRELTAGAAVDDWLGAFQMLEIKDFGHRLRAHLIYKWLSLGRQSASELATLEFEVRATEKLLTTLLGRNVVPSTPFNILTLLHMLESAQPQATVGASFGALYELLIKTSLSLGDSEASSNAEAAFTYVSLVAYAMYQRDKQVFSESDLRKIHVEYIEKFHYSSDLQKVLADLERAKVLWRVDAGYAFRYPHFYYYFVAKHFERVIKRSDEHAAKLRERLRWMSVRLHNEEFANILLFYIHLTEDWEATLYVIAAAEQIFAGQEPSNLEADVAFVNRIFKETRKLILPDGDIERHQEEYRRTRDEAEQDQVDGGMVLPPDAEYDVQLSALHKVNIAFKTLDALGQILRSLAGRLEGDQKIKITETCYQLGLRTLHALLNLCETNVEGLRIYFAALIKECCALNPEELTSEELAKRSDEAVIWLTHRCAFGTIKRISFAVGHQHLADTYDRVLSGSAPSTAVGLVDLQIKLEHFASLPEFEITRMRDKVVGNLFAYSVLRQMIGDFLYLYRTSMRTLQKFGAMFQIEGATTAEFLLTGDKRN